MRKSALLFLALALLAPGLRGAPAGEFDFDSFGFGPASSPLPGLTAPEKPLVTVSLLPEYPSIVPGVPFRAALVMDHAPGHYSYWRNPGGPGAATAVRWNLPPGFTVSEPAWPEPEQYRNGNIVSYVLRGKEALVYTFTPPADLQPGSRITLEGELETQICTSRSCNPHRQPVAVTVTAAAEPAGRAHSAVVRAEADLPGAPRGWRFEAAAGPEELVILMHPEETAAAEPGDIYFYDAAAGRAAADSQKPQRLEKENGVWRLRIPALPDGTAGNTRLSGIIQAEKGWLAGGTPKSFALDLPLAAPADAAAAFGLQRPVNQSVLMLLLFAFAGGLLLNVMPCVFPVIGLKIMGFAKQAHKDRRAVFLHGLAYAAGVLLCFWTLSFLVITMGRGWGAQLQSDWFMLFLCHLFLAMALNMAGVFEVGASVAGANQALPSRAGLKRSFFTGLLATITSTPCSAPFLGTALAYALSLPPLLALGVFTLMGIGFGFPYLALSLFPGWLKRLPKPGPWMETFRQAMCFPLFATTAYLFWTMEAMIGEWHFLMLLFGLVLTAMACWLYGKFQKRRAKHPGSGRAVFAMAALALAGGLWLGMPAAPSELEWREWSPETVARLREEGRPVYVDFTARWCATCQVNKRVYQDPRLVELLLHKNVALLKADWTQYDDRITAALKNEFNKAAVPVTVLYAPGAEAAQVLPDLLTVDNVTEALNAMPDRLAVRP